MNRLFLNTLKAMRVHRTLTGIGTLMIPVGFANRFTMDVLFLCLSLVVLYAAVGLQNARKDKDYDLPQYTEKIIFMLVLLSLAISLKHWLIFAVTLLTLLLGIFYNFYSRYVLFLDVTTVAATHHLLPMLAAALLLGLDFYLTVKLCIFVYTVYWLFIHIKNLKDGKDDQRRGYKTIATEFGKSKELCLLFFDLSFIMMVLAYFIFDFSAMYLVMVIGISFLKAKITENIITGRTENALNLLRLLSVSFVFSFVLQTGASLILQAAAAFPMVSYGSIMFLDYAKSLVPAFSKSLNSEGD